MRKLFKRLGYLILVGIGIYLLLVFFIIPFAAKLDKPVKWNKIPFSQARTIVHEYLGSPDSSGVKDVWYRKSTYGMYKLEVYYNAMSNASKYRMFFSYKYDLFYEYQLLESSYANETE